MSYKQSELKFVRAGLDDCEAVAALVNSAYRGDTSRQGWTTEADYIDGQRTGVADLQKIISAPGKRIFCVRQSDELIGCVLLEDFFKDNQQTTYLGMLTVKPTLQAQGVGRAIIAFCESDAKDSGSSSIVMSVIQIRDSLIAWYERRGYRRTGETKAFPYGESEFGIPKRDDLHFVLLAKQL